MTLALFQFSLVPVVIFLQAAHRALIAGISQRLSYYKLLVFTVFSIKLMTWDLGSTINFTIHLVNFRHSRVTL